MAKRQKAPSKPDSSNTQTERRKRFSKLMLQPTTNAAVSIAHLHRQMNFGETDDHQPVKGLDTCTLMDEMIDTRKEISSGNLRPLEDLLISQAKTLDAVFHRYLHQMDSADYLSKAETYARIALKAQHQSRQTIATLGELKHPKRATFIRQQNNAVNQQINQGAVHPSSAV